MTEQKEAGRLGLWHVGHRDRKGGFFCTIQDDKGSVTMAGQQCLWVPGSIK